MQIATYYLYKRPKVKDNLVLIDNDMLIFIDNFDNYPKCLKYLQNKMFTLDYQDYVFIVKKYANGNFAFPQKKKALNCNQYNSVANGPNFYEEYTPGNYYGIGNSTDCYNYTDVWYKFTYQNIYGKYKWKESAHRSPQECTQEKIINSNTIILNILLEVKSINSPISKLGYITRMKPIFY